MVVPGDVPHLNAQNIPEGSSRGVQFGPSGKGLPGGDMQLGRNIGVPVTGSMRESSPEALGAGGPSMLALPGFESSDNVVEQASTVPEPPVDENGHKYVGLVNQAMTCYLNSLVQSLYMTPEFRNAIYQWEYKKTGKGAGESSIPCQIQKLFLLLQTTDRDSLETKDLTTSFGWQGNEAYDQHDVQELCRLMFDALELKWKGTQHEKLIQNLYRLTASKAIIVYNRRFLIKFAIFLKIIFPSIFILVILLISEINQLLKQGPYVYELFSVMVHQGSAAGGHYFAYIKNMEQDRWYCFNDTRVEAAGSSEIALSFGGSYGGWSTSNTNAYMLMYRKYVLSYFLLLYINYFIVNCVYLLQAFKFFDEKTKELCGTSIIRNLTRLIRYQSQGRMTMLETYVSRADFSKFLFLHFLEVRIKKIYNYTFRKKELNKSIMYEILDRKKFAWIIRVKFPSEDEINRANVASHVTADSSIGICEVKSVNESVASSMEVSASYSERASSRSSMISDDANMADSSDSMCQNTPQISPNVSDVDEGIDETELMHILNIH
uniref:Ubiquitin carboxyl-terminal hydrolase n=1 Tax=Heterorhabditis bacteriophora TaxID=37862 RepID=A0A1I7WH50_HETBA